MSTTSSLLQDTVGKIYKARTHIPAGESGDAPTPTSSKPPEGNSSVDPVPGKALPSSPSRSMRVAQVGARNARGRAPGGALTSAPGRNANPQRVAHGVDLDDPEFGPPKSQI